MFAEKWKRISQEYIDSDGYLISDCGRVACAYGSTKMFQLSPILYPDIFTIAKDSVVSPDDFVIANNILPMIRHKQKTYVTIPLKCINKESYYECVPLNSYGYLLSGSHTFEVDDLVARHFIEPPDGNYDDYFVGHKNGRMLDNRACNLIWVKKGSAVENIHEHVPAYRYVLYEFCNDKLNDGLETKEYSVSCKSFKTIKELSMYSGIDRDTIYKKTFNIKRKNILTINNKKYFFNINYFNLKNNYTITKNNVTYEFDTMHDAALYICFKEDLNTELMLTDVERMLNKSHKAFGWASFVRS